jgi:hypothetical protein
MKTGTMVRISAISAAVLFFNIIAMSTVHAADDAARPAEFKVLDRWVGDWDLEITVKPNAQNPQPRKAIYKSSVRWTVNDRFLRCDAQGESNDGEQKIAEAFMWIITHDPESKTYTSSVFWSNIPASAAGAAAGAAAAGGAGYWGTISNGIGTWDEKQQMLSIRSEDKPSGRVTLSVTQWIDKDNHRWVQSLTEKNGNLIAEMSGTGKRRK